MIYKLQIFTGRGTVYFYYDYQARSCPYAKNQLLAHHFGKKKSIACAKKYHY